MAEQWAFNPLVQGSTPWRPTSRNTFYGHRPWHEAWHDDVPPGYRAVMARARSGYVQQLPSGAFRVSVYAGTDPLTGRQVRLRRTCRTERAAEIELGKLLEQAADGRRPDSRVTVADALARYMTVAELEPSTRETYGGYIRRTILPALGSMELRK